jgi:hypothetical protein
VEIQRLLKYLIEYYRRENIFSCFQKIKWIWNFWKRKIGTIGSVWAISLCNKKNYQKSKKIDKIQSFPNLKIHNCQTFKLRLSEKQCLVVFRNFWKLDRLVKCNFLNLVSHFCWSLSSFLGPLKTELFWFKFKVPDKPIIYFFFNFEGLGINFVLLKKLIMYSFF